MQPLPTVTLVPKVKMNSWTSNALVLLLLHCVRQEGVSASFTRCHLQRGFSVAEIHPWDSNSTLGCEVKAEDVDAEYHYFSSYKSSSENKTITILLTRGDRQPKSDLRLMLCSYEQVSWRVAADNPVTLKVLRVMFRPTNPDPLIEIDPDTVSVDGGPRTSNFYWGVLSPGGNFVEIDIALDLMSKFDSSGFVRSFTAVYSSSNVTLPIGVHATMDSSGNWDNQSTMQYTSVNATVYPTVKEVTVGTSITNASESQLVNSSKDSILFPTILSVCLIIFSSIIIVFVLLVVRNVMNRRKLLAQELIQLDDNRHLVALVNRHLPDVVIVCKSRLKIGSIIGRGHFGLVYKGSSTMASHAVTGAEARRLPSTCTPEQTYQMPVAVKSIRLDRMENESVTGFLKECATMEGLDHPNVLSLIGMCIKHPDIEGPLILLPFMANGDLKSYLSTILLQCEEEGDSIEKLVRVEDLMSYVLQICSGMEYLSSRSILHRDLAARNCMLTAKKRVKIADFGLARLTNEDDYYRQQASIPVPIKWMSPESLRQKIYSQKSDVWSFGVTAWEIFSLGDLPYAGVANCEVLTCLSSGMRLTRPQTCPQDLFDIIASCWEWAPTSRYNFTPLLEELNIVCDRHAGYLCMDSEVID